MSMQFTIHSRTPADQMDFGRPNVEIGWKMANNQLLFLALMHIIYYYCLLQEMQTKFATKIDELNQQVAHLQEENEKFQSLTTGAGNKPSHESDQEFHSSVEQQGHIDQPAQLQKRLKELESELESTRSTLEAERKKYEELKEEALHQQSTSQVKNMHMS